MSTNIVKGKGYSDQLRWMTIYPAYLDKKKTTGQGRRVPLQIVSFWNWLNSLNYALLEKQLRNDGMTWECELSFPKLFLPNFLSPRLSLTIAHVFTLSCHFKIAYWKQFLEWEISYLKKKINFDYQKMQE